MYVFLDTNVYVRYITQDGPGATPEDFGRLRRVTDVGKAELVIPEVALLELRRFQNNLGRTWKINAAKADHIVSNILNQSQKEDHAEQQRRGIYMQPMANAIKTALGTWLIETEAAWHHRAETLAGYVQHPRHVHKDFSEKVLLRAKRRQIEGKMPTTSERKDQDAAIIESLIECHLTDAPLLFCTFDQKDFYLEFKGKKVPHPMLSEGLPQTFAFDSLGDLVDVIEGNLPDPVGTPEEIREAAEQQSYYTASEDDIAFLSAKRTVQQFAHEFSDYKNEMLLSIFSVTNALRHTSIWLHTEPGHLPHRFGGYSYRQIPFLSDDTLNYVHSHLRTEWLDFQNQRMAERE